MIPTLELTILRGLTQNEDYTRKVLPYVKDVYFETTASHQLFQICSEHFGRSDSCEGIVDFMAPKAMKSAAMKAMKEMKAMKKAKAAAAPAPKAMKAMKDLGFFVFLISPYVKKKHIRLN